MSPQNILVTGATGKQGGALIRALLSTPSSQQKFHIYALTRNTNSPSATKLASNPSITVIQGDTSDPLPIFKSIPQPVHGVFSVTALQLKKEPTEESQAIPLIDAAVAHGVKHFVFASVERGPGNEDKPTPVPHFATKFRIEQHLKKSGLKSTILRPVAFFENLTPDFLGKGFATMWRQTGDVKVAFVGVEDVGRVAAKAFVNPDAYVGKAVTVVAEQMTFAEGAAIFKEVVGFKMPETFGVVGSALKWMVGDLGEMFKFFGEGGFAADMGDAIRRGGLKDFRTWLKEESKFVK